MQLYQTLFNPKLPFPTLKRHDYLCMTKKVISLCRKEAPVESDHLKVFKVQRDGRLTLVTCNDKVNNDNTNCCYSRQCFLRPEWSLRGILFQSHSTPIKHAIVRKGSFFTFVIQGVLWSWEKWINSNCKNFLSQIDNTLYLLHFSIVLGPQTFQLETKCA